MPEFCPACGASIPHREGEGRCPLCVKHLVVHCKHSRFDVYIGRPSKWGNPFAIGRDGTRAEVIAKYREWLLSQPELVADAKRELRGKVLGCWCVPNDCHGDVLAEVANT